MPFSAGAFVSGGPSSSWAPVPEGPLEEGGLLGSRLRSGLLSGCSHLCKVLAYGTWRDKPCFRMLKPQALDAGVVPF